MAAAINSGLDFPLSRIVLTVKANTFDEAVLDIVDKDPLLPIYILVPTSTLRLMHASPTDASTSKMVAEPRFQLRDPYGKWIKSPYFTSSAEADKYLAPLMDEHVHVIHNNSASGMHPFISNAVHQLHNLRCNWYWKCDPIAKQVYFTGGTDRLK